PNWDGRKQEVTPLENMVDEYFQVIKSVQPKGPYSLSGFSIGGVIAYEIAVKLQAAGDEIGILALIEPTPWNREYLIKQAKPILQNGSSSANGSETYSNGLGTVDVPPVTAQPSRMRRHLGNLANLSRSPKQLFTYIGDSLYGRGFRIYESISMPLHMARIKNSKEIVPRNLRDYYYLHIVSLELLNGYKPSQYNGDLHLFMIDRGPLIAAAIGWDEQNAGETIVHTIDVNEHSKLMKEPHVFKVAEILKHQLTG
ncbi:MAG: thioesterase domain-containing protein, partial [Anaerolineae bacterium]